MPETGATHVTELRERAVRAELNSVIDSAAFRTSKRCRNFLEYVVDHTLKGSSEALKERSIGIELFQLPPDFDAAQHTVVRVTANEVRKKLAQYYLSLNGGDGSPHPVRIEVPPGSYRAEFRWDTPSTLAAKVKQVEEAAPAPLPVAPAGTRSWWPMAALTGGLLATAAAISVWQLPRGPATASASRLPEATSPAPMAESANEGLRIIVGATSPYRDRSGREWGPDRFFTGGRLRLYASEKVMRTLDPDIYRHLRMGEFSYDLPLQKGSYELHLHFAEIGLADFISAESSGEGQRVFRVSANGNTILEAFDVLADAAGPNISVERVFRGISPAEDGMLHLAFSSIRGSPILSAIEVLPSVGSRLRPVRIRAGWTTSWQSGSGRQWQSDSYFMGGNALVRTTNPARESNAIQHDQALYSSERWGHFSYALPVADGRYRVTLKFCEGHYGKHNSGVGGVGSRVFDVYCNGVALLRNFDILKEAGGEGRPLDREFGGIRPNAQGKILLTFVPVVGMACVNGIEAVEEE